MRSLVYRHRPEPGIPPWATVVLTSGVRHARRAPRAQRQYEGAADVIIVMREGSLEPALARPYGTSLGGRARSSCLVPVGVL